MGFANYYSYSHTPLWYVLCYLSFFVFVLLSLFLICAALSFCFHPLCFWHLVTQPRFPLPLPARVFDGAARQNFTAPNAAHDMRIHCFSTMSLVHWRIQTAAHVFLSSVNQVAHVATGWIVTRLKTILSVDCSESRVRVMIFGFWRGHKLS